MSKRNHNLLREHAGTLISGMHIEKISVAYFVSDRSERKASFKKRSKGLIKKVAELSTLCGVDACAITHNEFQPQPEVWWSSKRGAGCGTLMEQPEMKKTNHWLLLGEKVKASKSATTLVGLINIFKYEKPGGSSLSSRNPPDASTRYRLKPPMGLISSTNSSMRSPVDSYSPPGIPAYCTVTLFR
ncbi:hypothetical protein F511_15191 [Dorcoceras hygrometricum]|uniref:MADS-box domain-containing protein n=1 Tax=Dorcoceras hygrometricum TaxID=472368 RepID=A0A2Z7CGJ5_9LAMI|nr:hypothetical protein F511_15191 [Dorcoceras hygrometricum]